MARDGSGAVSGVHRGRVFPAPITPRIASSGLFVYILASCSHPDRSRSRVIRRLPKRISAVLFAVLFLFSAVEDGFGAHVCPIHDLSPASHVGHGHAGDPGHLDPGSSPDRANLDGVSHAAPADLPLSNPNGTQADHCDDSLTAAPCSSDSHSEGCTCIGTCEVSGSSAVVPTVPSSATDNRLDVSADASFPAEAVDVGYPPHFLPYALV